MNDGTYIEEYKGFKIWIVHDDDAENPFKAWDCEPDIIGWHRRYDFNTNKEHARLEPEEFRKLAKEKRFIMLPLYMYDHSGLSFSTGAFSCPWDSGQLGFIYWTPEKIDAGQGKDYSKRITSKKREFLETQLKNACDLLNDYTSGNVYGFIVEDQEGNNLESCWGFYGDYDGDSGCLKEARSICDYLEKQKFPLLDKAGLIP